MDQKLILQDDDSSSSSGKKEKPYPELLLILLRWSFLHACVLNTPFILNGIYLLWKYFLSQLNKVLNWIVRHIVLYRRSLLWWFSHVNIISNVEFLGIKLMCTLCIAFPNSEDWIFDGEYFELIFVPGKHCSLGFLFSSIGFLLMHAVSWHWVL